jgi:hypothetical protein
MFDRKQVLYASVRVQKSNLRSNWQQKCNTISVQHDLRVVCIRRCETFMTNDCYPMLAEKWVQLERLEIVCSDISDAGVLAIHHHCKQLKALHFDKTPNISRDMRDQLPHLFPGVKFEPFRF